MALESAAWMIHGAEHSAAVARTVSYAATSASHGVVGIHDFKVSALQTPGGAVRVNRGAAVIRNNHVGGDSQTYIARNTSEEQVTIPASGSSGSTTWYLGVHVEDPQFEGNTTFATEEEAWSHQYVTFDLRNSIPVGAWEPLAKIVVPANTAAITQSMVTDLRQVANPLSDRILRPVRVSVEGEEELSYGGTTLPGEYWPNQGGVQNLYVPEWATHMNVVCTWSQVMIPANSNPYGTLTLMFGPWDGQRNKYTTRWVSFDVDASTNNHRTTFMLGDNRSVPADIRGTTQPFVLYGHNGSDSPAGKRAKLDAGSSVYMDIEFLQVRE